MARKDLTQKILNEPVSKLIISLSIPSIISLVITQIYQLTDAFFISSLGTGPAAAVAINNSLEQVITMAGTFLCTGASSVIARQLGAGRKKQANEALSFAFFSGFVFGILLLVFGTLFLRPLVRFLGSTPEIEQHCADYARYVLLAAPFMVASFVTNKILCAEGRATFAMVGMGTGAILNCILDPILIFTLNMGVRGASIATAISKVVSFVVLLVPYWFHMSAMDLKLKDAPAGLKTFKEVAIIGAPSLLRTFLANTSAIIMNNLAGLYSTAVLAGVATSNRLMMFISTAIFGMAQGYQPVVGQNWGAKKYGRVRKSFRFITIYAFTVMTLLGAIISLFAQPILMLFNRQMDPVMLRIGLLNVRSRCLLLAFDAWVAFISMAYTSSGKAIGSAILSMTRQGICYIPMLLILPRFFGAEGLALSQAGADIIALIIAIPFALSWVRELRRLEAEPVTD